MNEVIGWILTAVVFSGGNVQTLATPKIYTMAQCFAQREIAIRRLEKWPQPNIQLVCIPVDQAGINAL